MCVFVSAIEGADTILVSPPEETVQLTILACSFLFPFSGFRVEQVCRIDLYLLSEATSALASMSKVPRNKLNCQEVVLSSHKEQA